MVGMVHCAFVSKTYLLAYLYIFTCLFVYMGEMFMENVQYFGLRIKTYRLDFRFHPTQGSVSV